jgi:hypothetical protein
MSQRLVPHDLLLHKICIEILEIDNCIRFAGFANNMGKIIAAQYRGELGPVEKESRFSFLTKEELELSAIESVLRMVTRKDMISKLGKPIYSFTLYENVKRATISLENNNNHILMVSFDNNKGSNHESIILNGILPLVSYYLNRAQTLS